jgi:hypothetical protein
MSTSFYHHDLVDPGTPVSSTNKADHHDITEILLRVVLNTIKQQTNIMTSRPLLANESLR